MDLKKWLNKSKITRRDLSKMIGVSERSVQNILSGKEIYLSTALKIEIISKKEVTCKDLITEVKYLKLLDCLEINNKQIEERQNNQDTPLTHSLAS